jgi:hypothetical protein
MGAIAKRSGKRSSGRETLLDGCIDQPDLPSHEQCARLKVEISKPLFMVAGSFVLTAAVRTNPHGRDARATCPREREPKQKTVFMVGLPAIFLLHRTFYCFNHKPW